MNRPPLSVDVKRKIYELGQQIPRLSNRKIALALGIEASSVLRYRDAPPQESQPGKELDTFDDIRRLLKSGPLSADELADNLDCSPRRIRERIERQRARGAMILETIDGKYDLGSGEVLETQHHEISGSNDDWTHRFGVTTDNHLSNRHSRLDVLNAAYDHFEREGITTVYNAGNWIDGEARFNKTELVTAPGMDNQLDYMIDKFPVRKGITTYYIAGDDHEGWYQQREGVEVGRYLQYRAENQGRNDLKYLGYGEADVALKHGTGEAVMRVVHPGGASSYAISYSDQKRTESYTGGEKPHIELVGHYHKFNHGYPREIHAIQCGCTCDQSIFLRKRRIQVHVGFVEVRIKQDSDGSITRVAVEFFPFYDRGYYEKRF